MSRLMVVHDLLKQGAELYPDKTFIFVGSNSISYKQTDKITGGIAGGLYQLEVRKGECVSMFSDNSVEQQLFMLGCMRSGAIPVTMSSALGNGLSALVNNQESKVLFASNHLNEKVYPIRNEIPRVKHLISSDDLISFATTNPYYGADVGIEDGAHAQYSSGTTDMPNGVILPHGLIVKRGKAMANHLNLSDDDKVLSQTSGSSSFYLMYNLVPAMSACASSGLMSPEKQGNPEETINLISKYQVTGLIGNPLTGERFLEYVESHPEVIPRLGSLKWLLLGSAAVSQYLKKLGLQLLGIPVLEVYGQSEFGGAIAMGTPESSLYYPEFVGPVTNDGVVKIINEEGFEADDREYGEIVHLGEHMKGYINNPEKEGEVLRGGRLYTQDIGYVERKRIEGKEHLLLRFLGRKSEIINYKGRKIFPRLIEDELVTHPDIDEYALVGVPYDGEEVPVLAVTLNYGHNITTDKLMNYLNQRLPEEVLPVIIDVRERFEYTATGKIAKKLLRAEYSSKFVEKTNLRT